MAPLRRIACFFLAVSFFFLWGLVAGLTSPGAASPELQIPQVYAGHENIVGWYMSEKLDGVRGYWNGQQMLSQKGTRIYAPAWFTKNLPPFELDGELWAGRGQFETVQATVMDDTPSADWRHISYNIFEVPHAPGDFPAILQEPKNALVKQYKRLMWYDDVELTFTDEAIHEVAAQAQKLKTGARGLRTILEKVMLDVMYDIPSQDNVKQVVVTKEAVLGETQPVVHFAAKAKKTKTAANSKSS